MRGFFCTQEVSAEHMVSDIQMNAEPVGAVKPVASAKAVGEIAVAGKVSVARASYQVKIGVKGPFVTDKYLARQQVVANRQVVIGKFAFVIAEQTRRTWRIS